jgi:general secretion pathway protein G
MLGQGLFQKSDNRRGFTIVELLIVIVVIGILAAITIVAFNGVTNRAHTASAQSDAANLAQLLANSNTVNGGFPATLNTINNGGPLSTNDGTTYAYHAGSGNTSYCVTVTNATSSYVITDSSTIPQVGGCPGDGVGGVAAITNLAANPSFESGLTTVSTYQSVNSNPTTDGFSGTRVLRSTRSLTTGTSGPWWDAAAVTANTAYTVSIAYRSNVITSRSLIIEWKASDGSAVGTTTIGNVTTSSSWQTVSGTATAPVGAVLLRLTFYTTTSGTTTDYVDIDGVMITQGTTTYNFADGRTANWIWNGTPDNSSSTGPKV